MAEIIGNFCDTLAMWQFKEGGVGIATVMVTIVNTCFRLAVEHQETAMYAAALRQGEVVERLIVADLVKAREMSSANL